MITGIDISAAQGTMRWKQVPPEIRFAICKSSEGLWSDPLFVANSIGARTIGIQTGSYHVLRPNQSPEEQAKYYFANAFENTTMPPALDFEILRGVDPHVALGVAEAFVTHIEALWKKRCVIYTYPWFWRSVLGDPDSSCLGSRPLWIANYKVSKPYVPKVWNGVWTFWQFDGDGGRKLPWGTDADFNYFDGDEETLRTFCEETIGDPISSS